MIVVVVSPDGAVIASLMAEADDPALSNRFPGAQFIVPPEGVLPDSTWKYVDGQFYGPAPPTDPGFVAPPGAATQTDF